ncbi:Protein of unknown function [Neorhodopirellula lusitana]|uniref:DUF1573 domain-containing protein n=1 Tax=Neorhodopirellula lusitana TaxID=445327 RepID=A0ABY1PPA4_9BACT|nr:DUF1573 domain-containing protein [Neorhodopirellula lusitana]SMP39837.1 Protein of unknown function [Neorhodopirellula lusitana]
MKSNLLKFASFPVAVIGFITVAGAFTQVVEYKPYGVPDIRREEYEAKVALIHEQEQILSGEVKSAGLPVAVADHANHDFGMIDPHTTAYHAFKIANHGEGPLTLEVTGTSCKCTVGELTNNLLPPGAETTVTMEWNTGYQAEHYQQTATVVTNDPLRKEIELTVEGEVRAELIIPGSVSLQAPKLGSLATGQFVMFSQLWDDFTVMEIKSSDPEVGLNWDVVPLEKDAPELIDKYPKSALGVKLSLPRSRYGQFSGAFNVTICPGNGAEEITREIAYTGRVRPPISFQHPELRQDSGLEIGSLTAGQEYNYHIVVRVRNLENRQIEVLDVKPKELQATMKPLSIPGSYRLTLAIPKDCPMVMFNQDKDQGFVQVGDPNDRGFSNWFPVNGAVVKIDSTCLKPMRETLFGY